MASSSGMLQHRLFLSSTSVRRLLTILSAFSLLLCVAAGVVWSRSWRPAATEEDRISWLTSGGDRMTIRSNAGRVTLFEPPTGDPDAVAQLPQPPSIQPGSFTAWWLVPRRASFTDPRFHVFERPPDVSLPTLRETVAALRSDQLEWRVDWRKEWSVSVRESSYFVQIGSPAFLLSGHTVAEWADQLFRSSYIPPGFRSADAIPSLLSVLEDPERFVIAHLLLRHLYRQPTTMLDDRAQVTNGGWELDGLKVQLSEGKVLLDHKLWIVREGVPSIDPAQLPRIRDQWHRRLDVAKASAPWWAITATLALLPLVGLVAFVRRVLRGRQRQSRGLCRVCGYDLRASGGRCPECGSAA
jgi:hypothetical protein